MKILFTGFTANQCNLLKKTPDISIANFPRSIIEAARKVGYDVEWKVAPFDEPADRYDLIIINAAPCNSFMGRYGAMQSARIAADAYEKRVPVTIYVDDWQMHNFISNAKVLVNHPEKLLRLEPGKGEDARLYYFTCTREEIKKHHDTILKGFKLFISRYDRFSVVFSMHPWGRKQIAVDRFGLADASRCTYLDPTSVIPEFQYRAPIPDTKLREWTLAALIPHDKWVAKQNLRWPVKLFGCKALDGERLKSEQEIQDNVALRWGSLAPEYPHSGSGWFRSRFLYSAWTRGIMLCSGADASALGEPFGTVRNSLWSVQQVKTDEQLREIAEEQAKIIESYIWSYDQFIAGWKQMIDVAQRAAQVQEVEA